MNIERNADALARVYAAAITALLAEDYSVVWLEQAARHVVRDFIALLEALEDEQRDKVGVTAA